MTDSMRLEDCSPLAGSLSIHVGEIGPLLNRATHSCKPTDLVIAPVELHRRNLKLRLSASDQPLDTFEFTGPVNVGSRLLETVEKRLSALDRVDRLALLSEILGVECEATECFRMILGDEPARNAKAVEQARTEIETVTNYHPTRVESFRSAAESLPSPIDVDADDVLAGTLAIERELRCRTSEETSDGSILRKATRELSTTNGGAWSETYPTIERVAVVGLSSIPAPLADLLTALTATCDVEVELHLRSGSGPFLNWRIPDVVAVEGPGTVVFK